MEGFLQAATGSTLSTFRPHAISLITLIDQQEVNGSRVEGP